MVCDLIELAPPSFGNYRNVICVQNWDGGEDRHEFKWNGADYFETGDRGKGNKPVERIRNIEKLCAEESAGDALIPKLDGFSSG